MEKIKKLSKNRPFVSCFAFAVFCLFLYIYVCIQQNPTQKKNVEVKVSNEIIQEKYKSLLVEIDEIRKLKTQQLLVLETDPVAIAAIEDCQSNIVDYLHMKYGAASKYYVQLKLSFPSSMPDYSTAGPNGTILIETAPINIVPYSVFYFMQIVENFKSGGFHRNAGHVLQAHTEIEEKGNIFQGHRSLAWQEYSPKFPHKELTLGYAGRPGGPAFYISIIDNTNNHGPASQGSSTEADSCFGRIVGGRSVIERIKKQPGPLDNMGFVKGKANIIHIVSMRQYTVLNS